MPNSQFPSNLIVWIFLNFTFEVPNMSKISLILQWQEIFTLVPELVGLMSAADTDFPGLIPRFPFAIETLF